MRSLFASCSCFSKSHSAVLFRNVSSACCQNFLKFCDSEHVREEMQGSLREAAPPTWQALFIDFGALSGTRHRSIPAESTLRLLGFITPLSTVVAHGGCTACVIGSCSMLVRVNDDG